ncbi:MAG: hypothetical protein IKR17_02770 [Bacteroidales bacterium]|nr:hypothetical protein [Bacteroidales bacterium]
MDENRVKLIRFDGDKKEVWGRSLPFMKNPIKKKIYCDGVTTRQQLTYGGISAMAHYTALNPNVMTTYAVNTKEYKDLMGRGVFIPPNDVEGNICIEIGTTHRYSKAMRTNCRYISRCETTATQELKRN